MTHQDVSNNLDMFNITLEFYPGKKVELYFGMGESTPRLKLLSKEQIAAFNKDELIAYRNAIGRFFGTCWPNSSFYHPILTSIDNCIDQLEKNKK